MSKWILKFQKKKFIKEQRELGTRGRMTSIYHIQESSMNGGLNISNEIDNQLRAVKDTKATSVDNDVIEDSLLASLHASGTEADEQNSGSVHTSGIDIGVTVTLDVLSRLGGKANSTTTVHLDKVWGQPSIVENDVKTGIYSSQKDVEIVRHAKQPISLRKKLYQTKQLEDHDFDLVHHDNEPDENNPESDEAAALEYENISWDSWDDTTEKYDGKHTNGLPRKKNEY